MIQMLANFGLYTDGNSGGGLLETLLFILIMGVAFLLIWWVGKWILGQLGAPPIAGKAWDILFVLLGLIWAINLLLSFAGHGFIHW